MTFETTRTILDLRGKLITTFVAYEVASELDLLEIGGRIEFFTDAHLRSNGT